MLRVERIIATLWISTFLVNPLSSQEFALPAFIDDVTCCDIDLDGDEDITCICQVLNNVEDSIFIFYNDGDGNFQRKGYYYPNVNFILCGDLNNDEFPDIVSRYLQNIYYIPNNGSGSFGETVSIAEMAGTMNISEIININLDDWNDLIYSNTSGEYWGIFKNNGTLTFSNEIIQSGSSTTKPAAGFITNDSLPDIVLSYSAFNRSSVNINNGDFNFSEVTLEESFIGEAFTINIDNQTTDDFAFVNYYTNTIPLYRYIGDNQFELHSNFYAPGTYTIGSFLADDFNQDGYDDFLIIRCNWWYGCTDSIYVYFNDHNWSFNLSQSLYIGELGYFKAGSKDLNGDSYPDIFMKGCNGDNILTLLWNDGTGIFSFENPVNVEEQEISDFVISIFPNPFTDHTCIKIKSITGFNIKVRVSNILGQLVRSMQFPDIIKNGENVFNWDGRDHSGKSCPSGIYFIMVESNSQQYTIKVLKM